MSEATVEGIERAVFGAVGQDWVDVWLSRHLQRHLGAGLFRVLFRSGRISAVYGCRLDDGRDVVVKVHRPGTDVEHLAAAVTAQGHLARAGYPCPAPLHGPTVEDGRTVVVETLLAIGRQGDGADPPLRRALAVSLSEQVRLLGDLPAQALRAGAPSWARFEHGPWPAPHDPVFDFSSTPAGYGWLDDLAARAAAALGSPAGPDVIGHSDWYDGNVLFDDAAADAVGGGPGAGDVVVSAAFDWDSLAARPEAVIAGMSAASYTMGGPTKADTPTPVQVAAFLADYEAARAQPFTGAQAAAAAAAACWVLAYNARCELCFLPAGAPEAPGGSLGALARHRDAYLHVRP